MTYVEKTSYFEVASPGHNLFKNDKNIHVIILICDIA